MSMTPSTHNDLALLSKALGTLAFVLRDERVHFKKAKHAQELARLIEEFCRVSTDEDDQSEISENSLIMSPSVAQSSGTHLAIRGSWSCDHQADHSTIRVEAGEGRGRKLASPKSFEIKGATRAETKAAAETIVAAVNDNRYKDALIDELAACLELCLESGGLTWDAEHDASIMLSRTRPSK